MRGDVTRRFSGLFFQPIATLLIEKLATTRTHFLLAPVPPPHRRDATVATNSLSVSKTLRWVKLSVRAKQASSIAFVERAASHWRTCRTSCFLAGAPTTTCPRRWPIGWGWNWGKWSQRSSATRRRGESAQPTRPAGLFADSGALKRDKIGQKIAERVGITWFFVSSVLTIVYYSRCT